jgi:hypothetical protein
MPQARYARLSGAANHPAGARPSKCIISIIIIATGGHPRSFEWSLQVCTQSHADLQSPTESPQAFPLRARNVALSRAHLMQDSED